jgi:MFS family permease
MVPMEQELGWSKTDLNGALSLGLLMAGLFTLPIGRWIDRRGGRAIMLTGSIAGGALLLLWAGVTDLVAFYAIWMAMGITLSATLYEPAFAVLTIRLGPHYRRAITSMTLVGGFASTVFIPLTQILIEEFGWRPALVVLGLMNLTICVAIHWVMLRPAAEPEGGASKPAPPAAGEDSPLRRAIRTKAFWGLMVAYAGYGAAFTSLTFHLIPMLTESGMDMKTIVLLMAVVGPMQVAGRLMLLALGNRLAARHVGMLSLVMQPFAVLLLILLPMSTASVAAFACLYGMSNGMMTIVRGTIVPELLGRKGYGTINGALAFPAMAVRAVAPAIAAFVWTLSGGYGGVLWLLFAVYCAAAAAFVVAALSPPAREA